MEKGRKTKVIAILALVVAVVGMSLGFAAFSNILTISSSATVTPNEEDFKMVVYGMGEDFNNSFDFNKLNDISDLFDISYYTSTDISIPIVSLDADNISATNAVLSNELKKIKVENIQVNFTEPDSSAYYFLVLKNEGQYDAYINFADFENLFTVGVQKECIPGDDTTPELVEEACRFITMGTNSFSSSREGLSTFPGFTLSSSYRIAPNDYVFMYIIFTYGAAGVRADGNFSVQFEDLEFELTSAPKGTVLNP